MGVGQVHRGVAGPTEAGQAPGPTCENPGMGRLIPSNFDVTRLEPSERRTIEALVAGTGAEWLILPHVPFVDQGVEGEADVVVLHPERGGVVLEVKGGRISVRQGVWHQEDRALVRSPAEQAQKGVHVLAKKVKGANPDAPRPRLVHGIVLPDASSVPEGSLGPDLEARMVLTGQELSWPEEALLALANHGRPGDQRIDLGPAVRALRPDLDFEARLGDEIVAVERRLDHDTESTLRSEEHTSELQSH